MGDDLDGSDGPSWAIAGTAKDAGWFEDEAILVLLGGRSAELSFVGDEPARSLRIELAETVEIFDMQSRYRRVPLPGAATTFASAQWILLREQDGLAFKPPDMAAAESTLREAGAQTRHTVRGTWPGQPSAASATAGCSFTIALLAAVVAVFALVTSLGAPQDGLGGRLTALAAMFFVVGLYALVLDGPARRVMRWIMADRKRDQR